MVVDCLGELAYCEAAGFGRYAEAAGLSELSHARAHAAGAQASAAAWLAQSLGAAFTGEPAQALEFGEQALATADQRGDVRNAVLPLCIQAGVLRRLDDPERSTECAAEALRRAEEAEHPILINSAINAGAGALMQGSPTPDFAGGFEILSRYDFDEVGDGLGGLWLEVEWGAAFLGLDRSEAAVHAVRAARLGDRLSASHLFDFALRQLALVAFRGGLTEQAVALVDYTEARLRPYRLESPGQDWLQVRLDRALADAPALPPGPALHRGEVMAIVTEIETELGAALAAEVRTE